MNRELKHLLKGRVKQVTELIVVDLDTLIKYQDEFHDRKISCSASFDSYNTYVEKSTNPFDKFLSYSQFLPGFISDKGIILNQAPRFLIKEFMSKFPAKDNI